MREDKDVLLLIIITITIVIVINLNLSLQIRPIYIEHLSSKHPSSNMYQQNLSLSKPTPLPQKLTPLPQSKHEKTAYHHAASQQTHTSVYTNANEHGS
jgi:hypothetical protein